MYELEIRLIKGGERGGGGEVIPQIRHCKVLYYVREDFIPVEKGVIFYSVLRSVFFSCF